MIEEENLHLLINEEIYLIEKDNTLPSTSKEADSAPEAVEESAPPISEATEIQHPSRM